MTNSALRWSLFTVALLGFGPVAWLLVGTLHALDGARGTSPILTVSPAMGVLRAALAVLLAGAVGMGVRRLTTPALGLFCAGCVLGWGAWGAGSLDGVLRSAHSGAPLLSLSLEAILLLVPATVASYLAGGPGAPSAGVHARPTLPALIGTGIVMGLTAGLLCAWMVAQNTLKGQMIAAAAISGIAAGSASMLVSPRVPAWSVVAGVMLLAAGAPLAARVLQSSDVSLVMNANAGTLQPAAARLLPLDWLAGVLLGLPIGMNMRRWYVTPETQALPASR